MHTALLVLALCQLGRVALADDPGKDANYVSRLLVANSDGSGMHPVGHLPEYLAHGAPAWSRDGKLLGFDAHRPAFGESVRNAQIVVMNADGTNSRILCDGGMPSFSPQGRRIAFSRYAPNPGVWVMSIDGPQTELLLIDELGWGADWSPDGSRLAYTRSTNGRANLFVGNVIEGSREFLFEEASPYRMIYWNFAWSPDGKSIAFKGERDDGKPEVATVDARGAKYGLTVRLAESTSGFIGWTPDGLLLISKRVKERGNRNQLFLVDPMTNEPPQLLTGQDQGRILAGAVASPDGQHLAIIVNKPNEAK